MSTRSLLALSLALTAAFLAVAASAPTEVGPTTTTTPIPTVCRMGRARRLETIAGPVQRANRSGSTSAGGTSGTPLDPKSTGSTGVTTDPAGAIASIFQGFKMLALPIFGLPTARKNGIQSRRQYQPEGGRYCTYRGCNGDPSRSTVSLQGDVVVAKPRVLLRNQRAGSRFGSQDRGDKRAAASIITATAARSTRSRSWQNSCAVYLAGDAAGQSG